MQFVAGNSEIKSDCDTEGHCKNVMKGASVSSGFLGFITNLVDGIPGVELGKGSSTPPAGTVPLYVHPTSEPETS